MVDGEMWRVKDESVSLERLEGETILINFDSGQYFSFRGTSADVLWLVQTGVARSEWPQVLQGAFPGLVWTSEIDREVDEFLAGLEASGIIERADGPAAELVPLPDDYVRTEWSTPSVAGNDDLADLLVIDPIHDTGDDGWPQARPS